jgi:protein TonB
MTISTSLRATCLISLTALAACASSPPPPPPPPPTTQAQYDHDVVEAVHQNTVETPAIAASGVTGVVHIQIILDPSGQLVAADVSQSSGVPGLDNFALSGVENSKFPVLPARVPQQDQQFDLPIDYRPHAP